MSDTCWFGINVKNEDVEQFKKLFIPLEKYSADEIYDDDNCTEFFFYDANYAFYSEVEDLQTKGINFRGSHGAGSEYGPMRFAKYGDKFLEINSDQDGDISIAVNAKTGMIKPREAERAEAFAKLDQEVLKYFSNGGVKSIW